MTGAQLARATGAGSVLLPIVAALALAAPALALTPRSGWRSPTVRRAVQADRAAHPGVRLFGVRCIRRRWWDVCRATSRFRYSDTDGGSHVGRIVYTTRVHWGYGHTLLVTPISWTLIWPTL